MIPGRRFVGLILSVLICLTPAACGIPAETEVRVDGRGPGPGIPTDYDPGDQPPKHTDDADAPGFVQNYLLAAAGGTAEDFRRANEYLIPSKRLKEPGANEMLINIIRITGALTTTVDERGTTITVTVPVQQVGVLRPDGLISEPVLSGRSYTFQVGFHDAEAGQERQFLLDAPPWLLLNEEALSRYYQQQTIYFWSADGTRLVPELRHLPKAVPPNRRATVVLSWLIGGPSRWLAPSVSRLPKGTVAIGNVPDPKPDGRLEVNLEVPAAVANDEGRLRALVTQLVWSLQGRPETSTPRKVDRPRELELKIQGKSRMTVSISQHKSENPLYRVTDPAPFCIYQGKIRALNTAQGSEPVPVPVGEFANREVLTAGLSRYDAHRVWVAMVKQGADGQQLHTASGQAPRLHEFKVSSGSYQFLGRPVWLKSADPAAPTGLVVADGRLYRFDDRAGMARVELPGVTGRVTAVAAALDGQRIALVVNETKLYVATLTLTGTAVSVNSLRVLPTSLAELTAVDWLAENSLVLAGRRAGRVAIYELKVDGTQELERTEFIKSIGSIKEPVTQLAAYPNNPVIQRWYNMLYGTSSAAYNEQEQIGPDRLAGPSPSGAEKDPTMPSAPFFLY